MPNTSVQPFEATSTLLYIQVEVEAKGSPENIPTAGARPPDPDCPTLPVPGRVMPSSLYPSTLISKDRPVTVDEDRRLLSVGTVDLGNLPATLSNAVSTSSPKTLMTRGRLEV